MMMGMVFVASRCVPSVVVWLVLLQKLLSRPAFQACSCFSGPCILAAAHVQLVGACIFAMMLCMCVMSRC